MKERWELQMAQKYDILYVNFYTDGSAARKVMPAVPAQQPRKKTVSGKKTKKVIYLDPVAFCSIVVAAVLLIFMAVGLTQFQNARAEAQVMAEHVKTLTHEKEAVSQEFHASVDLESVEKTALALGMIPADQATVIQVQADPAENHAEQMVEQPQTIWEQFMSFLTNLFA